MIGPLSICVAGPLLLALVCLLRPSRPLARWCAMLGSVVTLAVGIAALADFAGRPGADFRLQESWSWSAAFGANFAVGVDGVGAAMLALSGFVTAIATVAGWSQAQRPHVYHALVLLLLGAMNGVFVALDFLVFYFCWEAMLIPMLLLIGMFGGEQRRYAALKFFVYTLAGSVLMLALLLALWNATPREGRRVEVAPQIVAALSVDEGRTLHGLEVTATGSADSASRTFVVTAPRGFDLRHLALQWRSWRDATWLGLPLAAFGFLAVLLACLVKLPAVPLHTWLPHAHVQAPTAVSVLLAGVLLKVGVYGLYRIGWPLFPAAAAAWGPVLGVIAVAGILWGAWVALGQRDLKRLVAYSSVSHMGFCLLGLASGTVAGATGSMVQAVAHGLSSSLLFLLVGVVYDRAHHRDVDGFGGLATPMPRFAWLLLFAVLASAGLPGLAGFVGEFLVFAGGFTAAAPFPQLTAAAVLSVVLSAAYLLWMQKRVAYGPLRHAEHAAFADCDRRELLTLLPPSLLLLALGVVPGPLVAALRPSCAAMLQQLQGALQ